MTREQNDQYSMLNLIEFHFKNNESVWSSNILVSDVKAAFSAKLNEINTAGGMQKERSTGATKDKADARVALEEKGFFISSVLKSYAFINSDHDLLNKKVYITSSGFRLFREAELLVAIENLNATATEIIEALQPYGVTQATLDALMAARTDFLNVMSLPRKIISTRKATTETIATLLQQAVALLDDRMDSLMVVFKSTEAHFFNGYFNDRRIHRTGHRKLSLRITTLDDSTYMPLADAKIEVVGHGIKRRSGENGQNKVQNLKEGYYNLAVSRAGFASQNIRFSIISGETTHLVIEMRGEDSKVQSSKVAEDL